MVQQSGRCIHALQTFAASLFEVLDDLISLRVLELKNIVFIVFQGEVLEFQHHHSMSLLLLAFFIFDLPHFVVHLSVFALLSLDPLSFLL